MQRQPPPAQQPRSHTSLLHGYRQAHEHGRSGRPAHLRRSEPEAAFDATSRAAQPVADTRSITTITTTTALTSASTSAAPTTATTTTSPNSVDYTNLTFYPAYCFTASPTFHKWVNITAYAIQHDLKQHSKFSQYTISRGSGGGRDLHSASHSSNTYNSNDGLLVFYLNHPIQFVQVVGVIVAIDEYLDRIWLLTIDDGSGGTIDVVCPKPEKENVNNSDGDINVNVNVNDFNALKQQQQHAPTTSTTKPAPPTDPSRDQLTAVQSMMATLQIGTVVQAKGTLCTFRKTLQIQVKRLFIVPSTSHELGLIRARNDFITTTLSKPWALSDRKQRQLRQAAEGEKRVESEREKRRRLRRRAAEEREERHRKLIAEQWDEEEKGRERERQAMAASGVARI